MNAPLGIAVLGAGTVGREVVRAFLETPDRLASGGPRLVLAGVAVRDVERAVADGIPRALLTTDPVTLAAADRVDVVCELLGGEEPARSVIAAALDAGKPVVTANKQVVARHGPELEAAARRGGGVIRFEAAVGGGIPVLATLAGDLAANRVTRLRAIVNGTTNVILSAMARDGSPYEVALAAAQAAGYAEADPTADVEAVDAANKLAILSRVAVGAWLDPDAIERRPPTVLDRGRSGIAAVTAQSVTGAAAVGRVLKLVADLDVETDGAISASVLPTALPVDDPLGRTDGRMNRIEVRAEPVGSVALVGPGAGGSATASAVLGDLLAIGRGEGSTWAGREAASDDARAPLRPPRAGPGRGWFLVLPPELSAAAVASGLDAPVECAPIAGGTAVHVAGASLAEVRATVRAAADRSGAGRAGVDSIVIFPAGEHLP
ncbi:MAG TPA: homoserine dehydrogenase [Candidatus Limnocylindrales bacterium]|nr:homoserine dehydrogenase [Candidatus Limnocylindrales bacterium]